VPPESLIKRLDDSISGRLSDHVAKLTKAQHTLIEVAKNNQLASDYHHMREAVPFSHVFPPVTSYVLYRPPDNSRFKMQMPKAGPYIFVSVIGDKYSIQDLLTHKVVDTHASNLSEFRYDPTSRLNPTEVAARNAGEFFVDKIVDHTGNVRRRSEMTFRVRWKGYTPDDDTWQPMKTVRETQAFVDYCTEKKLLSSLVSKKFKA
jgi:hypothetical protein